MPLTPSEADRLLLFTQAELARARKARGLLLNVPEATAIIADAICEWARDGCDLSTTRERARHLLTTEDVLPGVVEVVSEVKVEARFDDGTRLVVVADPFRAAPEEATTMRAEANAEGSEGRYLSEGPHISVTNAASTPIGITSHIHLAEVNPRLRLDRSAAFGMRLDVPTGDAVWIAPGQTVRLAITAIRGSRTMVGNTGVIDGPLDDPLVRQHALRTLRECGYLDIVDGVEVNSAAEAERAVTMIMEGR
jgi:urease subunit gamma/beta